MSETEELLKLEEEAVNSFGCDHCDNVASFTVVKPCCRQTFLECIMCVDRVVKATRTLINHPNSPLTATCSCGARMELRKLSDVFIIEPIK